MSDRAPRFTRRTVLGGAAAAGAGVLLGPVAGRGRRAPAVRRGSEPPARVQPLGREARWWIGRDRRAGAVRARRRAVVAPAVDGVRIELRTASARRPWGRWALASVTGHDADSDVGAAHSFGEPVWVGAADLIELRSSRPSMA